jgi:hypothetical protein
MTNTPTAPLDANVTHLELLTFCEEAFRNMRAPRYSSGEMSDVRRALATFARHRLASTQGSQGREAEAERRGRAAGIEAAAKVAEDRVRSYSAIPAVSLLNGARHGEAERIATLIRAITPVREAEAISTTSEGDGTVDIKAWFYENAAGMSSFSKTRLNRKKIEGWTETPLIAASPKVASDTAPGVREAEDIIRTLANSWEIGMSASDVERAADEIAALSASPSDSVGGVEG